MGQVFSIVDNTKTTQQQTLYIHFHNPTSSNCLEGIFRIVISSQGLYKLNKFQNITIDELKRLKGQYIKITGVIDIYKTKKRCFTQIVLEEPAQLELITPETAKKLISQAFNQLSPQFQSSKSSSQSFTNTQLTQPGNQQSSKVKSNNNTKQYSPQAIDPNQNYYQQGLECAKKGKYNQAIQFYDRELAANHNNFILYRSRGDAYYKLKQYLKAYKDYKKALRLKPQDANTEYMLNKVLEKFRT